MSTHALTQTISQRLISISFPRISLRVVWILSLIIIGFLLSFYISQVIELTETAFSISDHEKKIATLSQEDKNLEINFSQINSLANLEILIKDLNYEKIGDKVYYIRVLEEQVAAKP